MGMPAEAPDAAAVEDFLAPLQLIDDAGTWPSATAAKVVEILRDAGHTDVGSATVAEIAKAIDAVRSKPRRR